MSHKQGAPTNEAEVPPQRLTVLRDAVEFIRNDKAYLAARKEIDRLESGYVPASALAEVWEKAIKVAQIVKPESTTTAGIRGSIVEALEAARDAALSVGKGATSEKENHETWPNGGNVRGR